MRSVTLKAAKCGCICEVEETSVFPGIEVTIVDTCPAHTPIVIIQSDMNDLLSEYSDSVIRASINGTINNFKKLSEAHKRILDAIYSADAKEKENNDDIL